MACNCGKNKNISQPKKIIKVQPPTSTVSDTRKTRRIIKRISR